MNRLVALSFVVLGCTANAAPPDSCETIARNGTCQEYPSGRTLAEEQAQCRAIGGTFAAATSCTATNRVGRCTATTGGVVTVGAFYSPMYTTATASTSCSSVPTMHPDVTTSFQAN
jgi:hypothetical protein